MPKSKNVNDCWSLVPDHIFISHAYDDHEQLEKLIRLLPGHISYVIHPRQDPNPSEAVSDGIVSKILACDGMVYLEGGESESSLWVNFERDYGRRSGRKVFAFDPEEELLRQDSGSAVPLNIEVIVSREEINRAKSLLEWMKKERFFKFKSSPTVVRMKEIPMLVSEIVHYQRTVLWLMDDYVGAVARLSLEIPEVELHLAYEMLYDGYYSDSDFRGYARWLSDQSVYARQSPNWKPTTSDDPDIQEFILQEYLIEQGFHTGWAVDLVSVEDVSKLDWNRVDDLIVRLTITLQQSQPYFSEDDETE